MAIDGRVIKLRMLPQMLEEDFYPELRSINNPWLAIPVKPLALVKVQKGSKRLSEA